MPACLLQAGIIVIAGISFLQIILFIIEQKMRYYLVVSDKMLTFVPTLASSSTCLGF